MVFPLIISVRADEEAMALAHPNVLNLASVIFPLAICLKGEFEGIAAGHGTNLGNTFRIFHFAHILWILKMFLDLVTRKQRNERKMFLKLCGLATWRESYSFQIKEPVF
jgi:hypothetical protein